MSLNEFLENIVVSGGGSEEIEEPIFFNEFASYSTSESKNLNLAIQLYGEDQSRGADDENQPIEYPINPTNSPPNIWPVLMLISSLLFAILIDCWLLNIVLITYFYLNRRDNDSEK